MNKKLTAYLLDLYSYEDGFNCNTGSRLTMKPMAGPMPRRKKPAATPQRSRKASAPAV